LSVATPPSVDKSGERIRRMFGGIAHRYDFLNHFLSLGIDIRWRNKTVRAIKLDGDAPILDVCTGTGDLAIAFWQHAKQQIAVTGADFTPEMLELARMKAAKLKHIDNAAPLEFVEADALHLPFGDNMFQVVSVAFGLRNVSDTIGGLKEMVRVCRPGCTVAILEFSMAKSRIIGGLYRAYFHYLLPRIGQWFSKSDDSAYSYLPKSVAEFPDGEKLTALMRECGLVETSFQPLTFGVATLYLGRKPAAQ
jgi:demethylmenaquinone methyltransferase/2-methoxy-6-polyprenyl-1,4-benzoquinol methylase